MRRELSRQMGEQLRRFKERRSPICLRNRQQVIVGKEERKEEVGDKARGFRSRPEARGLWAPPERLPRGSDRLWSVSEDGSPL